MKKNNLKINKTEVRIKKNNKKEKKKKKEKKAIILKQIDNKINYHLFFL